jgi:hypothetical protein
MILFGCLLAWTAAVAPRLVLVLAWIFSDRWPVVWGGDWIMPLLGILLLPYTTIMYMLAWQPALAGGANIEGWDWLWILLGLFLDFMKWSQVVANRKEAMGQAQKYYPAGAPGSPNQAATTSAAVASGQLPPSTSPTAPDADQAPSARSASPAPPDGTEE